MSSISIKEGEVFLVRNWVVISYCEYRMAGNFRGMVIFVINVGMLPTKISTHEK